MRDFEICSGLGGHLHTPAPTIPAPHRFVLRSDTPSMPTATAACRAQAGC